MTYADEPDAFPFRGSAVLHGIARCACRGRRIYLTATPDEEIRKERQEGTLTELTLHVRPHGYPLPVPRIVIRGKAAGMITLVQWLYEHREHPRMVFVPSVRTAVWMGRLLSYVTECHVCTSRTEDRDAVMERFRNEPHGIMIATTVLERGITVKGTDVAVYGAESEVFGEASLVQMAGRAGRSADCPQGDVLFICHERSDTARQCEHSLQENNRYALPHV